MLIRKPIPRYNPAAYVRGGASLPVARAIQARGFAQPGPRGVPVRPIVPPRPQGRIIPPRPAAPAGPSVDPLWSQANSTVMGFMNPMLARLAAQRVAAEANARRAATAHGDHLSAQLVASAKPMDESFNRGIVASSTVNDALANRLSAQGGQAQGDLTSKLAQIGAADTGEVAKMYGDASNAGFASGSADLQHLISQRAAGGAYQAKLPGIGRLEGSRDLQQALSEMRENFGEQEKGLSDMAAEKSFDLWGTLRGEKREGQLNAQERIDAQNEQHARDKMAIRALQATAQTTAAKLELKAQEEALDRQNKITLANIRAEAQRYGVDNKQFAPPKSPSVVGPASQKWISVNGKKVANPNYVSPTTKGGTPAVQMRLKTNKATNDLNKLLFNPQTQAQRGWVTNAASWNSIVPRINATLVSAGIPANSPEGIRLRKATFTKLGVPTGKNGNPSDKKRSTGLVP